MAISKKMLTNLARILDGYEEEAYLLKNTICDRNDMLFSIRFLVLSYTESYFITPNSPNEIVKIDTSLSSVGFDESNMNYLSFINPLSNWGRDLCPYVYKILNDYIPIRFLSKCFFGLSDLENKWKGNKVLLVFFTNDSKINDPFYTFLVYSFYLHVRLESLYSYNDAYRISEDAAYLTLQKTLPIDQAPSLEPLEWQKNFVLLDQVARTMNDISSLYYESSECKGYFQFVGKNCEFVGIKFKKKILFHSMNARIIRKMLEAAKTYPLVVLDGDIVGIATQNILLQRKYTLRILGHLSWEYSIDDTPQFICVNSTYKFPISRINRQFISKTLKTTFNFDVEMINSFLNIVDQASNGHGALLIVTDNAEAESERLCSLNRGIQISPFCACENSQTIISDITTIDGAVIFDDTLKCHAFGIILDGEAVIPGIPSRGARYNSAKNYVMLKQKNDSTHNYMAVVISEDGMVNVFPDDHSEERANFFADFDAFKS